MTPTEESLYILQYGKLPGSDDVAPTLTPGGALTPKPQSETSTEESLRILSMSPEEIRAQAKTPPAVAGGFNQRAGSFATAGNEVLAGALGAPFDFSNWLGNQAVRGINAVTGAEIPQQTGRPWLGSENIKDWLGVSGARAEGLNSIVRGRCRRGTMAALTGMVAGGALQAAGRAPVLARTLLGGGQEGLLGSAANLATGAGGGAGSAAGGDLSKLLLGEDNPYGRLIGETAGGLLGGVSTALAPAAAINTYRGGRAALLPFTPSGQQALAGKVLNESATYGAPDITPSPLGTRPTLGQASNDPGLLALERTMQQASPAIGGELAARATENNQFIRGGLVYWGNRQDANLTRYRSRPRPRWMRFGPVPVQARMRPGGQSTRPIQPEWRCSRFASGCKATSTA